MGRLLKYLLLLVLFLFLRSFLRTLFASLQKTGKQPRPPQVPEGGELKRDPVCGTFIPVSTSITEKVNGELVHFCSEECRRKYRAA